MATTKSRTTKQIKLPAKPKIIASRKKISLTRMQKNFFICLGIVIITVGAYAVYSLLQNTETDAATCASRTFKQGSNNTCVKYIQQIINSTNTETGAIITANGSFTKATKTAVMSFQQDSGLTVTGTVDVTTWKELRSVAETKVPETYRRAGCGTTMVKYQKIGTVNNCGTMQGGTTDGTYMYFACTHSGGSTIKIVKYTLSGKKVAESKTFARKVMGHANDMTYNKNQNILVVAAWDTSGKGSSGIKDQVELVDPATLTVKDTKALSDGQSVSNICYNDTTDQYVSNGKLYDANFTYLRDVYDNTTVNQEIGIDQEAGVVYKGKKTDILNQGITCDSSHIYIMRVVYRQNGYNMVAAYDWNGNITGIYRVDLNDEGENLSVINGTIYMGVNEGAMSSGGNSNNDYFVRLNIPSNTDIKN